MSLIQRILYIKYNIKEIKYTRATMLFILQLKLTFQFIIREFSIKYNTKADIRFSSGILNSFSISLGNIIRLANTIFFL